MKLIKLELQAFGSFNNKEIIDFTLFNNNKIFLISGKTGSGKTTIFDAISYALFGKLTGQFKSDDMIRSHYATDSDETYVKLQFIEQNKLYEIYRKPTYKVLNKKTPEKGQAILTSLTDTKVLATKSNETNKLIEEILKFNHEQFKQIVVLPQGEFIKILNSNSNEKEKLLSSLLNTSIYNKIIDKLKEKNYELESKLEKVKAINENILNKYNNVKNIDELRELLSINKEKYNNINTIYTNINNELSKLKLDIQNYSNLNSLKIKENELKDKLLTLDNKKEEIDSLRNEIVILNNVSILKNKYDILNTYTKLLSKEKENHANEECKFNLYKIEFDNINKLELELNNKKTIFDILNNELGTIKTLELDLKSIKTNTNNIKIAQNSVINITNEIDKLKNINLNDEIEEINNKIIDNKNIITSYDPSILYKLEYDLEKYNNNVINYNKYNDYKKSNDLLIKIIDKFNVELSNLEINLNNLKELKNHNLLENFIELVQDNKPCPLCGSLSHPDIIQKSNVKVSNKDIEKIEKDIMSLKLDSMKRTSEIENNNKLMEELKSKIDINLLQFDVNSLINKINIEQNNKENYKKAIEYLNILDDKKKLIEVNIEETTKLLNEKQSEVLLLNQQIDNFTNLINEANNKINEFTNGKDLREIKNIKENEIGILNIVIKDLTIKINNINNNYQNSKNNLDNICKLISDYDNKIAVNIDEINTFMINNNINEELYLSYINKLNEINSINSMITDYDIEYAKIKSLIDLNMDKLINYELVDLTKLDLKLKELEESYLCIKNDYDNIFETYKIISNDYNSLIKLNENNKENIKQYEIINELYRLSNGTYSKVSKINLQKYVLGIILDKIIIYANYYLKSFTSSRYQLKRIDDESSSNRGLDLAVIDAQTGLERSVGSLSGGESFMCALALAIGMSEGISSMSGGIKLENIFIDEGFGSLDNEALDNAIEALMMLASNGRMIGIISHVSDIKTRISDVITVEKTKNGSKIII